MLCDIQLVGLCPYHTIYFIGTSRASAVSIISLATFNSAWGSFRISAGIDNRHNGARLLGYTGPTYEPWTARFSGYIIYVAISPAAVWSGNRESAADSGFTGSKWLGLSRGEGIRLLVLERFVIRLVYVATWLSARISIGLMLTIFWTEGSNSDESR
jgi:hypothetical protein